MSVIALHWYRVGGRPAPQLPAALAAPIAHVVLRDTPDECRHPHDPLSTFLMDESRSQWTSARHPWTPPPAEGWDACCTFGAYSAVSLAGNARVRPWTVIRIAASVAPIRVGGLHDEMNAFHSEALIQLTSS